MESVEVIANEGKLTNAENNLIKQRQNTVQNLAHRTPHGQESNLVTEVTEKHLVLNPSFPLYTIPTINPLAPYKSETLGGTKFSIIRLILWAEPSSVTIELKAVEQYFPVVFLMLSNL